MPEVPPNDDERLRVHGLVDLPPLSLVAQKLVTMLADDDIGLDEVAQVVEMDPGITARIIGVARSAFFGNAQSIYTVKDAIIRVLGLDMVRSLALGIALGNAFTVEKNAGFDARRFWTTALLTADMARYTAPRLDAAHRPEPEPAYLSGLMHNLGVLPLVHLHGARMKDIFRQLEDDPELDPTPLERERLGLDHHQAGAWLAHRWHLPREVIVCMEHYHEPDYHGPERHLSLLVGTCSRWVQRRLSGATDPPPGVRASMTELGVSEKALATIADTFERKFTQTSEMAEALANGE